MPSDTPYYRPEGSYSPSSSTSSEDVQTAKWNSQEALDRTPFIRVSELMEHEEPVFARPSRRSGDSWLRLFRRRTNRFQLLDSEDNAILNESFPSAFLVNKLGCKRRICFGVVILIFSVLGIIHAFDFVLGLGPLLWENGNESGRSNWGPRRWRALLNNYPVDFTKDVLPIPCHSHNDYWRRVPLYEAIHFGCTGVEADVWLFDQELYVGHDTASLHPNNTLRTLYVNPLIDILDKMNPTTQYNSGSSSIRGVFDQDPSQTLVLLIDFKNSGPAIWPYVSEHISALRAKNYLTYWNGQETIRRPITVVATGNAPFNLLTANTTYRDVFFDAPLDRMWQEPSSNPALSQTKLPDSSISKRAQGNTGTSATTTFDTSNSFYASVSFRSSIGMLFRGKLTDQQIYQIRGQIAGAHARGLKARYWGAPSWPVSLRNHVWKTLVEEGADFLNVDDLRGAARGNWGSKKGKSGGNADWR